MRKRKQVMQDKWGLHAHIFRAWGAKYEKSIDFL